MMRSRLLLTLAPLIVACGGSPSIASRTHYQGPVVDMHAHVLFDEAQASSMSAARPPSPQNLLELLGAERLQRLGAIVMAPRGIEATRIQNDRLLALVAQEPRIFAIASVHPLDGEEAVLEVARVAAGGARMIKLHQNTQGFDLADPSVGLVLDAAAAANIPVLFEGTFVLDPASLGKFVRLAATHPNARIVLAHLGFTDFRQLLLFHTLAEYPWWQRNVWFDISASVNLFAGSPVADEFVWVVRTLGVDRVMFGSDFPVHSTTEALEAFEELGFTEEEERAILHDTASTLLRLQ